MSDSDTKTDLAVDNASNCKVCNAAFKTLQECLAHELLKHTLQPQKKLRKCLDAITKRFASEETQAERDKLKKLLVQTADGKHLRAVLRFYAGNCGALAQCYQEVRKTIQNRLQGQVKVYAFGSLVTGLALKDSDIDLFLEQTQCNSSVMTHSQLFNRINRIFRSSNCFTDVIAIRHARVPIIRCKHAMSGLSLDISMSSPNSTHNSRFIAELLNRDVRLRELFLFLKIWAKKLNIIGSGSMTSYCLMTLIIYQLQQQRLLPSIKELQTGIPVLDIFGINFAYSFQHVPALPASLSTFDLIMGFFELYSHMDFEKKLLSPYLGLALDVEAAFTVPGNFPEYNDQMLAIERFNQEPIETFQIERCVCVQDPFELMHNVGQSISQTNLIYLNKCLAAAAKACNDAKLISMQSKFYDYLLFGIAEQMLKEQRLEYEQAAKLHKQMQKTTVTQSAAAAAAAGVAANEVQTTATVVIAKTDAVKEDEPKQLSSDDLKPTTLDNMMPLMHVYTLKPTNNDMKTLRAEFLSKNRKYSKPIHYLWAECYVDAIKDILSNIYALNMQQLDTHKAAKADALPKQFTWLISTTLDTWSGRNFQHSARQSFFSQQLQQTVEFTKTRPQNPSYVVNLSGRLSLIIAKDYKELRLELRPMAGDALGLQRQSPLTKFFKSLKNMLCNYNFKEKVISLQYER